MGGLSKTASIIAWGWFLFSGCFCLAVDCPGLAITTQPQSQAACEGGNASFSIGATGVGTLSYQWRKDCQPLVGETSATLTFDFVEVADYATYECVVSDDCGVLTSQTVSLTMSAQLGISQQPADASACTGFGAFFSVTATGDNLSYQWRRDCVPIPGEVSSSLNITPVTLADEATYDCVVYDDCGSLTTEAASLQVTQSPIITSEPVNVTVCIGASATFSVTATGAAPLAYQWIKDGFPLPGATNASLTLDPTVLTDWGNYVCKVTNGCDETFSNTAILTLELPPEISQHPADAFFCDGDNASFTVAGTNVDSYQWRKDCQPIPGETSATLNLTSLSAADIGSYTCVLTNACGFTTSQSASLLPDQLCGIGDPGLASFLQTGSWFNELGDPIPIDINGDGQLSQSEVLAVTGTLDLSGLQLTSLAGLEIFTNLTGLDCSNNLLESWPDLSAFIHLLELDLSQNRLNRAASRGAIFPAGLQSLALNANGLRDLPDLTLLNDLQNLSAAFNLLTEAETLAAQNAIGGNDNDTIILHHNLFAQPTRGLDPSDCSAIQTLLARVNLATFDYNPQFNFSTFPQWPQSETVLDLIDGLEVDLVCGSR